MRRKNLNLKRGSEAVETILVLAIVVSVLIVIFYPQLKNMLTITFNNLSNWFVTALNNIQ